MCLVSCWLKSGPQWTNAYHPSPCIDSTPTKDTTPEQPSGEKTTNTEYSVQTQLIAVWVNDDNSPSGVRQVLPMYIKVFRRRKRLEQMWKCLVTAVSVFLHMSFLLSIDARATLVLSTASAHAHNDGFSGGTLAQRLSIPSYNVFYMALREHSTTYSIRDSFAHIASRCWVTKANQIHPPHHPYTYTSALDAGSPPTSGSQWVDYLTSTLHTTVVSLSVMK